MGYTTYFDGEFRLDRPLTQKQIDYLKLFADTRRMKRDAVKAERLPDPVRKAARLPIGPEGAYFVGGGFKWQGDDESVLDHNSSEGQPSLWCQWVPTEDGKSIVWDGGEKFDAYVEWLEYIIHNFLTPWKRFITGEVTWSGEDDGDKGKIRVQDNVIHVLMGRVVYDEE